MSVIEQLPEQFKQSTNIINLFEGLLDEQTGYLLDNIDEVLLNRRIQDASGENLDLLGMLFGATRNGLSDPAFRSLIIFTRSINRASGATENLISIIRQITNANNVFYNPLYSANFQIFTDGINGANSEILVNETALLEFSDGQLLELSDGDNLELFLFDAIPNPVIKLLPSIIPAGVGNPAYHFSAGIPPNEILGFTGEKQLVPLEDNTGELILANNEEIVLFTGEGQSSVFAGFATGVLVSGVVVK